MKLDGVDSFITDYVKELHAGTAAIFAGAGLSAPAGFVDWITLLQPLAAGLGLNAERECEQLVALAQYHVNNNGMNRSELHKRMLEEFPTHTAPATNHKLLARLPISVFWTTNYDKLIERALDEAGKIADVKYTVPQLAYTKPRRDATVYKMHGDIEHPNDAVITKDDYERYPTEKGAFINSLTGDLVSKTFLFIGFSFKDPNLDYILSRIRVTYKQNSRQHYCIFKRVERKDGQSQEEHEYLSIKQRLAIEDLKRFNIKTLLIDDYHQITQILQRIDQAYRRRTLFISGSADEFDGWTHADVSEFLVELGKIIIHRGYRLVSGFGWGISNELLSGAIEQIYSQRLGHIHDHLVVRPFPRFIADQAKRDSIWHEYRKDLISQAGIAIFLFGNKKVGDSIQAADGVRKEYELAKQFELLTIPVGATGYVSEELGQEVKKIISDAGYSQEFQDTFSLLQEKVARPQELLSRIVKVLECLPQA